jgi:hypothetical protein
MGISKYQPRRVWDLGFEVFMAVTLKILPFGMLLCVGLVRIDILEVMCHLHLKSRTNL